MSEELVKYPEVDIRKDKTERINIYLCFMRDRTICVKSSNVDDVKKRYADEPAFHITEIVDGMVFHYLAGKTKNGDRELMLTKRMTDKEVGNDRIVHVLAIADRTGKILEVISEQRRMPREHLAQLDRWNAEMESQTA